MRGEIAEYASTGGKPNAETSPAASAADVDRKEQRVKLAKMKTAFNNLQKIVDRLHNRIEEQERKLDDLEQYGRSHCLIVHRCEEVPNRGKIWNTKNMFAIYWIKIYS